MSPNRRGAGMDGREPRILALSLALLIGAASVQADILIGDLVYNDDAKILTLENTGGEVTPIELKTYISYDRSLSVDSSPFNTRSLAPNELPGVGLSEEIDISGLDVPTPQYTCGAFFLVFTLTLEGSSEAQEERAIRTDPSQLCEEDIDLQWKFMEEENNIRSVPTLENGQLQTNGFSVSIVNKGQTDVYPRSPFNVPEVKAFVSQRSYTFDVVSHFANPNITLQDAVEETVAMERYYWITGNYMMSIPLEGWETLLLDVPNSQSKDIPIDGTIDVALSELKASMNVPCDSYSLLVLLIDPFNKTIDSNRTNNMAIGPVFVPCNYEDDPDPCIVLPDAESNGRDATLVSWSNGWPTAYKYKGYGIRGGFAPVEHNDLRRVLETYEMIKGYSDRLDALGQCPDMSNEGGRAINESIAMQQLTFLKTLKASVLSNVTAGSETAMAENEKVKKILELADNLLTQALTRDGPVRYILLKLLSKVLQRNLRDITMMGGMNPMMQGMGPGFMGAFDFLDEFSNSGFGGPMPGSFGGGPQGSFGGGPQGSFGGGPQGSFGGGPQGSFGGGPQGSFGGGPQGSFGGGMQGSFGGGMQGSFGGGPQGSFGGGMQGSFGGGPPGTFGGGMQGSFGGGPQGSFGGGTQGSFGSSAGTEINEMASKTDRERESCDTIFCKFGGSEMCIPSSWICDSVEDCEDELQGADEKDCPPREALKGNAKISLMGDTMENGEANKEAEKLHFKVAALLGERDDKSSRKRRDIVFPSDEDESSESESEEDWFMPNFLESDENDSGSSEDEYGNDRYNRESYQGRMGGGPRMSNGRKQRPPKMTPEKMLMAKVYMRLATNASPEEMEELGFLDINTRQLIKDVFSMIVARTYPKFCLPFKMYFRNESEDLLGNFMRQQNVMSPADLTPEIIAATMDFMKTNLTEAVRRSIGTNQTLNDMVDLATQYMDIIKNLNVQIYAFIQRIVQRALNDPQEVELLTQRAGPEPTKEMYCMEKAGKTVALAMPSNEDEEEDFFKNPFKEFMALNKMKERKSYKWVIEKGAIYRGIRSGLLGTMYFDKLAVCSYRNWNYNQGGGGNWGGYGYNGNHGPNHNQWNSWGGNGQGWGSGEGSGWGNQGWGWDPNEGSGWGNDDWGWDPLEGSGMGNQNWGWDPNEGSGSYNHMGHQNWDFSAHQDNWENALRRRKSGVTKLDDSSSQEENELDDSLSREHNSTEDQSSVEDSSIEDFGIRQRTSNRGQQNTGSSGPSRARKNRGRSSNTAGESTRGNKPIQRQHPRRYQSTQQSENPSESNSFFSSELRKKRDTHQLNQAHESNIQVRNSKIKKSEGMVSVEGQVAVIVNKRHDLSAICEDEEWGVEDARVICRSLLWKHMRNGYKVLSATPTSVPADPEGPRVRISQLKCTGYEDNVLRCKYLRDQKCKVKETAGVKCVLK